MISMWNLTHTKYGRQKNSSEVRNNGFDLKWKASD
jgi:hypothetical protein